MLFLFGFSLISKIFPCCLCVLGSVARRALASLDVAWTEKLIQTRHGNLKKKASPKDDAMDWRLHFALTLDRWYWSGSMNHYTPFTQILKILVRHGVRPLNILTPVLFCFLAVWPFVSLCLSALHWNDWHTWTWTSCSQCVSWRGTKLRLSVVKLTQQCSE